MRRNNSSVRGMLAILFTALLVVAFVPLSALAQEPTDDTGTATGQPSDTTPPPEGTKPPETTPPPTETQPATQPPATQPAAQPAEGTAISPDMEKKLQEIESEIETPGEEIVITGSLIKRKTLITPAPVSLIQKAQLEASGKVSIGEILQNLPSQSNAINIQVNNGGDGSTRISLRGIGDARTLVLVNGRRHVPGGAGADSSVDLSTIPAAIIERVEVLKDGASAVYGSDAIGGVVNIITRKEYQGVEANAYAGTTKKAGQIYELDVTAGIKGEKGSVIFSAGYYRQYPLWSGDRDWAKQAYSYNWKCAKDPTATGCAGKPLATSNGSPGVPEGLIWDYGEPGNQAWQDIKDGFPDADTFIYDPQDPTSINGWRPFKATGNRDVGEGDFYNYAPANYLATPQERLSVFSMGRYLFSDMVRGFFEMGFNNRKSDQKLAPEPLYNYGLATVSPDNIYNPFGRDFIDMGRRMIEGGNRIYTQDQNTFRFVGGLEGSLVKNLKPLDSWMWNLSYNYGRSQGTWLRQGSYIATRLQDALGPSFVDETGVARCGTPDSPIAECVPLDLFHGPGTITKQMLDYITYTGIDKGYNELTSILFTMDGELFKIPFGETVALAVGYEYDAYAGGYTPDPLTATGNTTTNAQKPTQGQYFVNSAFGELSIPLVSKVPGLEMFEINAATRYSTYNTFGDYLAYKAGARWQIIKDVALRGTFSTAFRAPSIYELYGGQSDSYPSVTDPCDISNTDHPRTDLENANCRADNIPDSFTDQRSQEKALWGGNPELQPETAKIITAGIVIEPRWVKGFSITLDYFNLTIDDAIQQIGSDIILSECYNKAAGSRQFCDKIFRDPATKKITRIVDIQQNIGGVQTSGLDFALAYDHNFNMAGRFMFSFEGTWLHKYNEEPIPGLVKKGLGRYDLGAYPDLKFNFSMIWGLKGFGAGFNVRFVNGYMECKGNNCQDLDAVDAQGNPDQVKRDAVESRNVDAYATVDLFASYDFQYGNGYKTKLSLGVNNVIDATPPRVYNSFTQFADEYNYDFFGRYFYIKLTQNL